MVVMIEARGVMIARPIRKRYSIVV